MTATDVPADIRRRLCLVLDSDDLVAATRLARELQPYFGVAKVGLELYAAAGPDAIGAVRNLGFDVFADLKLHDIPNTVGRAAAVLGSLGARYVTLHAHGGVDMLRAGVEGLAQGADGSEIDDPVSLAVTVLTSDDTAPPHILPKRVQVALEAGCNGLVCAVDDIVEARQYAPRFTIVTPGIRPEGADRNDQRRTATPSEAVKLGSDLLVIGRAVTASESPVAAAAAIVDSLKT